MMKINNKIKKINKLTNMCLINNLETIEMTRRKGKQMYN